MTQEDMEDFENKNVCRFCEKEIITDKVRDHCHLTGKYRGPGHNICNQNVTQQLTNIIVFTIHNFKIMTITCSSRD